MQTVSVTAGGARSSAARYRPALDGMRAIAVYLVVVFHAGSDRFTGGFIGVDVFFVLSGFLVTQLLLRDLISTGRVGFARFYARRFRRLLPAAFVALVVTALVYSALASPLEMASAAGGFRASFLYSANWYFIAKSSDYFGAGLAAENPVLHFWSLAVEEQFYLLWPLLLGGLFAVARRFGSRQWWVMRGVVGLGAVASLVWALSLRTGDPNRAYYGTDARAYQLLAGALIALTPGVVTRLVRFERHARRVGVVGILALGGLASSWVHLDAVERGAVTTAITVVLVLALEAADGGVLRRTLAASPAVYLGKISYATYLWHWPVIVVITRSFDLAVITTIAVTVLVATALASVSFELLEHPIRLSALLDRHRYPVIVTGLAVSLASALVVIPAIVERSSSGGPAPTEAALATAGFTPVPTDIDWAAVEADLPAITDCDSEAPTACTRRRGRGAHVLILGDSHAAMLVPALTAVAEARDLTLSVDVRGGCPWQRDLYRVPETEFGVPQPVAGCRRHKDDAYDRVLPALRPDLVVVMNLDYLRRQTPFLGPDGTKVDPGSAASDQWIEQTTRASLDQLAVGGRRVLIVEPTPVAPIGFRAAECLSTATVVEQCRYVAAAGPSTAELLYRRLDQDSAAVWAVDLDRLVCPYLPICDPIVEHRVVQADGHHLTTEFSRALASVIDEYLLTNRILP